MKVSDDLVHFVLVPSGCTCCMPALMRAVEQHPFLQASERTQSNGHHEAKTPPLTLKPGASLRQRRDLRELDRGMPTLQTSRRVERLAACACWHLLASHDCMHHARHGAGLGFKFPPCYYCFIADQGLADTATAPGISQAARARPVHAAMCIMYVYQQSLPRAHRHRSGLHACHSSHDVRSLAVVVCCMTTTSLDSSTVRRRGGLLQGGRGRGDARPVAQRAERARHAQPRAAQWGSTAAPPAPCGLRGR